MKVILGWHFNFRTLTITLPEHKYIVWSREIQQMIKTRRTTKKQLESTIGCLGHVGFMVHGSTTREEVIAQQLLIVNPP